MDIQSFRDSIFKYSGVGTSPTYGVFWWVLVRLKPDLLRELLKGWHLTFYGDCWIEETLPEMKII